jgi:hypothetical protein
MYLARHVFKVYTIDSTVHKDNKDKLYSKLQTVTQTGITINPLLWKKLVVEFNKFWIYDTTELKKFYRNVYTIYYEDFKDNIAYINKLLNLPVVDIPSNALTEKLPYNKWDLINNKKEVIDIFSHNTDTSVSDFYSTIKDNIL